VSTHIYVNPEEKHILSATDDDAILLGSTYDTNEDENCVIYVPRALYFAALGDWLDGKADYNKRYGGDWCGVGNIIFDASKIDGHKCHISKSLVTDERIDPDDPERYVDVSAYRAGEDYDIDMEHG